LAKFTEWRWLQVFTILVALCLARTLKPQTKTPTLPTSAHFVSWTFPG
jgi:hypothetical protein